MCFIIKTSYNCIRLHGGRATHFIRRRGSLLHGQLRFAQGLCRSALRSGQLFHHRVLNHQSDFNGVCTIARRLSVLRPRRVYHGAIRVVRSILRGRDLAVCHVRGGRKFTHLATTDTKVAPRPTCSLRISR